MKRWLKIYLVFTFAFLNLAVAGWSQADYAHARKGDMTYEEGRYMEAETSYRKALEIKPKASTSYNLANSMFLQERIPEAIEEYKRAVKTNDHPQVKAQAYYNMGNAYFQNQEYQQSINAYKESLKINPSDEDAKKNLMLAMRQLKHQQQPEQQKQEQQQQQQQEEEQNKDQQEQEQQQGESPQQKEEQKKEDISKEEAKEILKAIEREDQRVQEKLKKSSGKSTPPVKDW